MNARYICPQAQLVNGGTEDGEAALLNLLEPVIKVLEAKVMTPVTAAAPAASAAPAATTASQQGQLGG